MASLRASASLRCTLHRAWLAEKVGTPAYEAARAQVSAAEEIRTTLLAERTDPGLQPQARKALSLMARGWPRLTRFLQDPGIRSTPPGAARDLRRSSPLPRNLLEGRHWIYVGDTQGRSTS